MIREMLGALRLRPVLVQLPRPRTFPMHWHRACLGGNNLQISRAPRQEYT
jgi:hypothetical protein